jgi:hypothetical protein
MRMKRIVTITCTVLLVIGLTAFGQTSQTPTTDKSTDKSSDKTTENAERITTGEITKIDAKKKILTVREVTATSNPAPATQPQNTGRRGGGGGMGGVRVGGGMGVPFPGGGGRTRTPGTTTTTNTKNQGKPFKVTITDTTSIKDTENTISFGLLRVGDRLTVQGLPQGSGADLKATQITVNR